MTGRAGRLKAQGFPQSKRLALGCQRYEHGLNLVRREMYLAKMQDCLQRGRVLHLEQLATCFRRLH